MSEWEKTTLGEVTRQVQDPVRVESGEAYPLLGVRWYGEGPFHRETVTSETSKAKRFFKVREGQFIYNRLFAWKGSFGLVGADLDGAYVSNEFPVFECDRERLLPEFLNLQFKNPNLWSYIERVSTGTTASRNRWKEAQFNAFPIALPSLAEQRRIVDLMAAVDAQIEALETEVEAARRTLSILNTDLLSGLPTTRTLGEFTSTRSGPSFAAADSTDAPSEDSVPAIGIPNTRPDGSIDMSSVSHVVGLPASVARIDGSSLILIRTNGNRQRIGNVYLPGDEAHGHIVSAFQFLMKVNDPALREFTYWVLRERSMQAAMSDAASGTTGLGNLAVKWLNSARVHWSDDASEREEAIAPLRAQDLVAQALTAELVTLRAFRSTLLTALLNQEIEIPESYDELLEVAS